MAYFKVTFPEALRSPVVFASPHSGRDYPTAFLQASMLNARTIRSSEDAYVDRLLEAAPYAGAPLLTATVPRAYVDLNRDATELDPALIEGLPKRGLSPRVNSGLGVIPRVVAGGRAIYRSKITQAEAHRRLSEIWHPYHRRLDALMTTAEQTFGEAVLIDVHSMPQEALEGMRGRTPDIVLGDKFGASCADWITAHVQALFEAEGLRVLRNSPFAGAYITQTYGKPMLRRHALQVEIHRGLYLDEARVEPSDRFAEMKAIMDRVIPKIAALRSRTTLPLAAE